MNQGLAILNSIKRSTRFQQTVCLPLSLINEQTTVPIYRKKSHHSIGTTYLSNNRRMPPRRMDKVPTYSLHHLQSYCQLKGTKKPVKSIFGEK